MTGEKLARSHRAAISRSRFWHAGTLAVSYRNIIIFPGSVWHARATHSARFSIGFYGGKWGILLFAPGILSISQSYCAILERDGPIPGQVLRAQTKGYPTDPN